MFGCEPTVPHFSCSKLAQVTQTGASWRPVIGLPHYKRTQGGDYVFFEPLLGTDFANSNYSIRPPYSPRHSRAGWNLAHVVPAQAGTQSSLAIHWIPAFAGMTNKWPRRTPRAPRAPRALRAPKALSALRAPSECLIDLSQSMSVPVQGKRLGWCQKSSCVTSKWADQ